MYTATITTAMPMTSLKPRMNDAPSRTSRNDVRKTACLVLAKSSAGGVGQFGFWIRWTAASAVDSVLVMTKSVAANPSSTSTSTLPPHPWTSRASIPIDPWPACDRPATYRYSGSAPNSVTATSTRVASGASSPAFS